MEYEFIQEKVENIDVASRSGKYTQIISHWEKTDNKTLKFKCKNQKEKKCVYSSIKHYCANHKKDWTIICESGSYNIYAIRS